MWGIEMASLEFKEHFQNLIDQYREKYGHNSQIDLLLNLEFLGALIYEDGALEAEVFNQYHRVLQIVSRMNLPKLGEAPLTYSNMDIIFSENYYDDHYLKDYNLVEINDVMPFDINQDNSFIKGKWYMYVVDSNDRILLLNTPYSLLQMLGNRSVFPPHPAMVQSNLTARGAGEIFIGNNDRFILTNKSGHFRPMLKHLKYAKNILENMDDKVEVFPIDFELRKDELI